MSDLWQDVWDLYAKRCESTIHDCSIDEDDFLCDLREILEEYKP